MVTMPEAIILCPVCNAQVEDLDLHPSQEPVIADGVQVAVISTGYGRPYITLLPCQHRIRHNGFRMIAPHGRIEGEPYVETE